MTVSADKALAASEHITDDATLAAHCARWRTREALALDTEFMRVSTYYPRVALLQVADEAGIALIDPLRIDDWEPFAALMRDAGITKILHSCSEDLLVFFSFLRLLPSPMFDTQMAAALLGEGVGLSYQNLVKQRYGIDLPKAQTRSDWLQRPLSAEQLEYAVLDVAYLIRAWREQRAALKALGRDTWLAEDCARQAEQYACEFSGDFSDYYLNFKSAWQLQGRQLAALQKLATWREQRARKRDKPRNWILRDTALFRIAQELCTSKAQLAAVEEVSENFVRIEGNEVLALLEESRALPEAACPPPVPRPLNQSQKSRLKKAQELVERKSMELGIPPEVLGRRRTLQALLYAQLAAATAAEDVMTIPAELQGWRGPLLLRELLAIYAEP